MVRTRWDRWFILLRLTIRTIARRFSGRCLTFKTLFDIFVPGFSKLSLLFPQGILVVCFDPSIMEAICPPLAMLEIGSIDNSSSKLTSLDFLGAGWSKEN